MYIDKVKSIDELISIDTKTYKECLTELENQADYTNIKSDIPRLDYLIGGFQAERLYILSAPTKSGKTTMCQTIMYNTAKKGIPSLMLSYENSWQEVTKAFRSMANYDNKLDDLMIHLPVEYFRGANDLQFDWLEDLVVKAQKEKGIELVLIDHLHFLLPLKDYNNASMIITGIVRKIKSLAVKLKIPIILVAHTRKVNDDKVPEWTDIKDSVGISQESDVIMMMYRIKNKDRAKKIDDLNNDDVYTDLTMFSVELNRHGGTTGRIRLKHNGAYFQEMTDDEFKLIDFSNTLLKVKDKKKLYD